MPEIMNRKQGRLTAIHKYNTICILLRIASLKKLLFVKTIRDRLLNQHSFSKQW